MTAIDGTKEAIIADLAKDAAKTLDDAVLAKALGGTQLFAAGKVHRSDVVKASTATVKDIRKAVRLLQLSAVPKFSDGFYRGLVHPDVKVLTSLNVPNSVKLLWKIAGQYRAKLRVFAEGVTTIGYAPHVAMI